MLYESVYYGVQYIPSPVLVHHGILGQKWGKRNGPPYPLRASDHSAREKKAGWRSSLSKRVGSSEHRENGSRSFKLTDKQKTALKVAGGAVAAGLVAYGLYRSGVLKNIPMDVSVSSLRGGDQNNLNITDDVKSTLVSEIGDNGDSSLYNKEKAKAISEATGLPLKKSPDDTATNCALANDDHYGNPEYANDCGHSVISWVLNEMGLSVEALPIDTEYRDGGMTPNELKRYFKGLDWGIPEGSPPGATTMVLKPGASSKEQISSKILEISKGENSAGIWRAPGHYMGWKVGNGVVTFTNPQIKKDNCDDWFASLDVGRYAGSGIDIARIDNIAVHERRIKNAVRGI